VAGKGVYIEKLLPEGMVKKEERTEKHAQVVLEHWLEHGDLSTMSKRAAAQSRNRQTQRCEPVGGYDGTAG
jgi:hypothetical protein